MTASSPNKQSQNVAQSKSQSPLSATKHMPEVKIKAGTSPAPVAPTKPAATGSGALTAAHVEDNMDLMSMAQSFLASMLEVEMQEGPQNSPGSDSSGQKKQPRKKLTNKPNPTLLKQKALMERERLEEMKRNDQKLKMKCAVELKKAEEVFPYAKEMLEARAKKKLELEELEEKNEDNDEANTSATTAENKSHENKKNQSSSEESSKSTEEESSQSTKSVAEETENAKSCLKAQEEASEEISEKANCLRTASFDSADNSSGDEEPACNGDNKQIKANLNNSDADRAVKEKHKKNELESDLHKNVQKMDIEEDNSNTSTNRNNEPDAMEVDECLREDAATNGSKELDETKLAAPAPAATATESSESEATKQKAVLENETGDSNADMVNKHNENQRTQHEDNSEKTVSQKDDEHGAILSNTENSKNVNGDDELPQNIKVKDKATPALMEELVTKRPSTDAPLNDSSKTSASNGNAWKHFAHQ